MLLLARHYGCLMLCVFPRLQFVFIFTAVLHSPVTYGDYQYPPWAIGLGWVFAICSIVPLPGFAIYSLLTTRGPLMQVGGATAHMVLRRILHGVNWGTF